MMQSDSRRKNNKLKMRPQNLQSRGRRLKPKLRDSQKRKERKMPNETP